MKLIATFTVSLIFLLAGAACSKDDNQTNVPTDTTISEVQQAHLLQLYEEEKLAHDIYQKFLEAHAYTPFSHIVQAEATHMGFVNDILVAYQLSAPQNAVGIFENAQYQAAYNEWLPKGLADGKEACMIAAYIEEMDILDLMNAIQNVAETDDIKVLYELLKSGSENHLRAYNRFLEMQFGVDYKPQLMDQQLFDQIIADSGSGNGHH